MLKISDACKKNGVPFGITPSDAQRAAYWARQGARFYEMVDEMSWLQRVLDSALDEWREAIG